MKEDFGVARLVIGVLEALGWVTVILGGVVALVMFANGGKGILPLALLAGFLVAVLGILQVASAQIIKAGVVTAENSAAILALAEKQFGAPSAAGGRVEPVVRVARQDGLIKNYKGRTILRAADGVKVEGEERVFKNVIAAERFIDGR